MAFVLPPKSQVGYLDPEVAGEGTKVILSDGEQVSWSPPPPKPVMPDWSQIKALQKYFNRQGHQVWPAWLYHPDEPARLVKSAQEAAELGVCYREASVDEKGRYGRSHVWDWKDDSQWRPQPHGAVKFDPAKPGSGKTYIPSAPNPVHAQNDLVAALIPAVAAAVAQSLKGAGGPAAPANVDPKDWDDFIKFKAWQETAKTVEAASREAGEPASGAGREAASGILNALFEDSEEVKQSESRMSDSQIADLENERASWLAEAERKGVKIDKRWATDRIKSEVMKAA